MEPFCNQRSWGRLSALQVLVKMTPLEKPAMNHSADFFYPLDRELDGFYPSKSPALLLRASFDCALSGFMIVDDRSDSMFRWRAALTAATSSPLSDQHLSLTCRRQNLGFLRSGTITGDESVIGQNNKTPLCGFLSRAGDRVRVCWHHSCNRCLRKEVWRSVEGLLILQLSPRQDEPERADGGGSSGQGSRRCE